MQGATVLVVDDDATIRTILGQFLEEEGYRVQTAANGREVIEQLGPGEQQPDIMLLDLLMPEVDGTAVLDYLRKNLLQEFPVLIFSAQRPGRDVIEALDTELRDFIAKPFELEELLVRMELLLRRSPRTAAPDQQLLRVYTLGSLRVYRGDSLLFDENWRNKPAKTLFKLLFTHPGRRYPKDVLGEALWPEADLDTVSNRLRVAIHELRKVLGEGGKKGQRAAIAQQEGAYFFNPNIPYWSDLGAFEATVQEGNALARQGRLHDALHAYQQAEALYCGDYLRDDPFFDWTIATRERAREQHLNMLAEVARIYSELGQPSEAAGFCRKILRVEPWREEVYRHLMEYLVAAGRPMEALRAYEECVRALRNELDAAPSAETVVLRDAIARGETVAG